MNSFKRKQQKEKEVKEVSKYGASSVARIEKKMVDVFMNMNKTSAVPIKILFYIARINYKTEHSHLEYSKLNAINISIDVNDLCEYCKITKRQLKDGLKRVQDTTIEFYDESSDMYEWFSLIPHGRWERGANKLEITMFLGIILMVRNVSEKYVNIDVDNLMKLSNPNTLKMVQILEVIQGYNGKTKKQKKIYLEEFNGYFSTKYRNCYDFEKFSLSKIKKELDNNSKITFDYEPFYDQEQKKGRPKQLGFTIILKENSKRQTKMFT